MVAHPWIVPEWPAPARVHAVYTTRAGGVSRGSFASLNLSDYVGDAPGDVAHNRAHLRATLGLPDDPHWLRQVHGTRVCDLDDPSIGAVPEADCAVTSRPGRVCAIQTADCLPVLLCDVAGTRIAAVHAGWRGLAAGVIEAAIATFDAPLLAWLGPAIGPMKFEVGAEVRNAFVGATPDCERAFRPGAADKWRADLYELARIRLHKAGVDRIFGGGWCTFSQPDLFFSYRRETTTGRMAALIWIDAP